MARRGVFGRVPRSAPSLTSEIISLAEAMASQEDSAIMDAWQNGGTYKGRPVTDEMVIEHWQQRLSGVSKDDPLYDTYKNNVTQLRYQVAYSKKYTAYLKGGRTDNAGMAAFFQEWAKKVPHDSQFFRTLQQDAAGYINLARNAARASASAVAQQAYTNRRNAINKQYLEPAEFLNGIVDNYAAANGLIPTGKTTDYLSSQASAKLYDMLEHADGNTVLYTAATGKQITVDSVRQRIGKYAPGTIVPKSGGESRFGITADDLNKINQRAVKGAGILVKLARQHGSSTDVRTYTGMQQDFGSRAREDGTMSVDAQYWQLRHSYEDVVSDPTTSAQERLAAFETYSTGLTALAGKTDDENTRNRITAEATGDVTQRSLAEDAFGFGGPADLNQAQQPAGDIATEQQGVVYGFQQKMLDASIGAGNIAVWTTGDVLMDKATGQYVFVPNPSGSTLGVTSDLSYIRGLFQGDTQTLHLEDAWASSGVRDVQIQGVPVVFNVAPTGVSGNAAPSTQVATAYIYNDAGQQHIVYRYTAVDGRKYFTTNVPWNPSLPVSVAPDGSKITIDGTSLMQTGQGAIDWAKSHPGLQVIIAGVGLVDPNKVHIDAATGQVSVDGVKNGQPIGDSGTLIQTAATNPAALLFSSDPTRTTAPIPTEDFSSLTQAAITASPGGDQEWQKLYENPNFRYAVGQDIVAGARRADGSVDQGAMAAGLLQATGHDTFATGGPSLFHQAGLDPLLNVWSWVTRNVPVEPTNPGEAHAQAVAEALARQMGNKAAGVLPKSVPPTIPAPPAQQPDLATVGHLTNTYNVMSLLGLVPKLRQQDQQAPGTQIQNAGNIRVPIVPPIHVAPPAPVSPYEHDSRPPAPPAPVAVAPVGSGQGGGRYRSIPV